MVPGTSKKQNIHIDARVAAAATRVPTAAHTSRRALGSRHGGEPQARSSVLDPDARFGQAS